VLYYIPKVCTIISTPLCKVLTCEIEPPGLGCFMRVKTTTSLFELVLVFFAYFIVVVCELGS